MSMILKIIGITVGVLILSIGILLLIMPKQAKGPRDIESREDLDAYFEEITRRGMPPAVSVSVSKNGRFVYDRAFGYTDPKRQVSTRTDTIYPWWSVTKLVTSIAVLQLVEDGRLELEDPLTSVLPDFEVVRPNGEPVKITIRQILNHSAGFRDIMPDGVVWIRPVDGEPVNQSRFVRERLVGSYRELIFDPGSDVAYSNTGYIVLGAVIEELTGLTYEAYVQDRILGPLGMTDTAFIRSPDQQRRTATPSMPFLNLYSALMWRYADSFFDTYTLERENGRIWMKPVYTDYTPSTGLSGPSGDLAALGRFLLTGESADGSEVLKKETVDAMKLQIPLDELPSRYGKIHQYGYGLKAWRTDDRRVHGHAGGGAGYGALLVIIPEDNLVITVNANDSSINRDEMLRVLTSVAW